MRSRGGTGPPLVLGRSQRTADPRGCDAERSGGSFKRDIAIATMARTAQDVLEFDKVRELLRLRTTCALGRRAVDAREPSTDQGALETAFAHIREAREWLRAERELGFGGVADPQQWLERSEGPGVVLDAAELLDAASLLETTGWLRQHFREEAVKFPLLAAQAASLADFRDALAAIRRCVLPNREISDDASTALRRIRGSIAQTRDSIQKTLKHILRARTAEAGEDYVTLRNDRFVIPVRAENRRSVPGIMHGTSGTGQTGFLEPFETVETNNQLVQLAEEEAAEIVRILRELTERLQLLRGPLIAAKETIAEMDSIFARARFARDFDAAMPEFNAQGELRLMAARHPVLEDKLRRENRAIVPMSLALGGDERVLVISGPNTGGQTVALKTTGIAVLSAQSGIPVAAQRAVLPLFDCVLVDIGDEQSIAADLSTFSAHMLNLKSMLQVATPQSLVLVDDTSRPFEGVCFDNAGRGERGGGVRRCESAADVSLDGRRAGRVERDCHRAAAGAGEFNHRACQSFANAGIAGSRGPYRLLAPQPGRIGPHATTDDRGAPCAGGRTHEAAQPMGRAATETHQGARREICGDAEALRRECGARGRGSERARTARAIGKVRAAQDAGCPQRGAGRAERGWGGDAFGFASGPWHVRSSGNCERRPVATGRAHSCARVQQTSDFPQAGWQLRGN